MVLRQTCLSMLQMEQIHLCLDQNIKSYPDLRWLKNLRFWEMWPNFTTVSILIYKRILQFYIIQRIADLLFSMSQNWIYSHRSQRFQSNVNRTTCVVFKSSLYRQIYLYICVYNHSPYTVCCWFCFRRRSGQ